MTAKRLTFTELALDRLSTEGTYWDNHTRAFGCRVGKTKKTLFIVRSDGSREIVGYVGQTDLKTARRKAQALLLSGPSEASELSFQEAFELYRATKLRDYRERSRAEVIRLIEKHMAQRFSSKIADTNHHHIQTILTPLKPSEANHLYGVLRTFFTWCEKRDLCASPMKKLDRPHKSESRSRILTDEELARLWIATAAPTPFNAIVRLCLLTGQRRGEISQIRREWIAAVTSAPEHTKQTSNSTPSLPNAVSGADLWLTIPKHITKNGTEHSIPITNSAYRLLLNTTDKSSNSLIFQARGSDTKPFSGWSKSKAFLDNASGVTDWTLHDLRRTWASLAARWGIPEHLAARIQNHKTAQHQNPIRAIYQRYEFRTEMREAMERYETNLLQLLSAHGRT